MKIVYHDNFKNTDYASNGASVPNRMETIMKALVEEGRYKVICPEKASYEDLSLAHSYAYISNMMNDIKLFEMASLSVGGAILASEIAFNQEPAFACIRPPGHHASKTSGWGYCVFSNIGIALLKLKNEGLIKSAFLLDIDAHTGDGTIDVLSGWNDATTLNPMADTNNDYISLIENTLDSIDYVDIVAVSAGFDSFIKDMGKKLTTFDFYLIGRLMKKFTKRMGHNRRFATLEGGYYLPDIGKNTLAFCQGFE